MLTSHRDDEVGFVENGAIEAPAAVVVDVDAHVLARRDRVGRRRRTAGKRARRRDRERQAGFGGAVAQDAFGHGRTALVGGTENEDVDAAIVRAGRLGSGTELA